MGRRGLAVRSERPLFLCFSWQEWRGEEGDERRPDGWNGGQLGL